MEKTDEPVDISSEVNAATVAGTPAQTGVVPRESMFGFSKKLQPPFLGGAMIRVVVQGPTFLILYVPPKILPCKVEIWQREDIEIRC
jgi:hypothetical protein